MTIPIPEIRRYLTSAYSDDELSTLCADYFRDVYEDFAAGMTKAQKIGLLLDYCQRRDQLPNLLAALNATARNSTGRVLQKTSLKSGPRYPSLNATRGRCSSATRMRMPSSLTGWQVTCSTTAGGYGSLRTAFCRAKSGPKRSTVGWKRAVCLSLR